MRDTSFVLYLTYGLYLLRTLTNIQSFLWFSPATIEIARIRLERQKRLCRVSCGQWIQECDDRRQDERILHRF